MSNGRTHRRRAQRNQIQPGAIERAAAVSSILAGCTCTAGPNIGQLRHGQPNRATVSHDEGCPAGDVGSVHIAIIDGRHGRAGRAA